MHQDPLHLELPAGEVTNFGGRPDLVPSHRRHHHYLHHRNNNHHHRPDLVPGRRALLIVSARGGPGEGDLHGLVVAGGQGEVHDPARGQHVPLSPEADVERLRRGHSEEVT